MPTTWTAVTVTAAPELAEAIGSFLLDCGAPGLQSEDAADATRITAHFADAPPLAGLETFFEALAETFPDMARPRVEIDTVTDSGWAENWKAHFPPLAIGARLFVHPPWVTTVPEDRLGLVLDPGMAFGTGHHASTRGCLVLLERALHAHPRAHVLDLGTGSGILAIAAARLGAAAVWAVDIDAEACAIAVENCAINQVADRVQVSSSLTGVPATVDVVLANLFAGQLIGFSALIAGRLIGRGVAIGAGMLVEEAPTVREAWTAAGLRPDGEHVEDGWVALAHRRQP